jgi:Tol biopolymer transport system component
VTRLTPTEAASYDPAWSPDGRLIAFVSERDGNAELYVMNADGTNPRRLTDHTAVDRDPAWSPDGTRIAFSSERDGNAEIYLMGTDGTGLARITASPAPDGHPAWSPDGNRIAFAHGDCIHYTGVSGCSQAVILVTSPTGSAATEVGAGDAPSWSPDGFKLAVTGYTCGYDFYYDYCTVTGIGILTPVAAGPTGYIDTWAPELTRGMHFKASWRP